MGALRMVHELRWRLKLCAGGYACHELVDELGVRWAWVINAGGSQWDAHLGTWGQARELCQPDPPVGESIGSFRAIEDAKAWVEEGVASAWKAAGS